jgi:hypothetical protein
MDSIYRQCVAVQGEGWGGGVMLNCAVDHILQEFYTLFLTRFRTYKIASQSQTKITSKDDIQGLVSLKFLRPWCRVSKLVQYHKKRPVQCALCSDLASTSTVPHPRGTSWLLPSTLNPRPLNKDGCWRRQSAALATVYWVFVVQQHSTHRREIIL